MITLGMANWNSAQLEEEIEHPQHPAMSWLVLDYDEKLVFGQLETDKPDDIWERLCEQAIRKQDQRDHFKNFQRLVVTGADHSIPQPVIIPGIIVPFFQVSLLYGPCVTFHLGCATKFMIVHVL